MEWNIIAALLLSVAGVVTSIVVASRGKRKDDKGEGRETGVVLTELGYIKGSVDGLNKKLDRQEERNLEVIERLASVEASAKQAHKRLDHLEGRADNQ